MPEIDLLQEYNERLVAKLEEKNIELEKRTDELNETQSHLNRRAEALEQSNAELARFNRLAVGRELRMVELKRQINELCQQLGKPPAYDMGRLADTDRVLPSVAFGLSK